MRSRLRLGGMTILGIGLWAILQPDTTQAYPRYRDGCHTCHGRFSDGTSPKGTVFPGDDKHRMHRSATYMNSDCDLCHTSTDDRNPWTGSSDGTANNVGYGCTGCHGRDYGGNTGVSGVGLRAHHTVNGVPDCAMCHIDDPLPLPENVAPPYYGTVDTNANDPCNLAPEFWENWSIGDTIGLDNDGDDLYDEADPDCAPVAGDANGDGVVDLDDYPVFADCMGGPSQSPIPTPPLTTQECLDILDFDGDLDVDEGDYGEFLTAFSGYLP